MVKNITCFCGEDKPRKELIECKYCGNYLHLTCVFDTTSPIHLKAEIQKYKCHNCTLKNNKQKLLDGESADSFENTVKKEYDVEIERNKAVMAERRNEALKQIGKLRHRISKKPVENVINSVPSSFILQKYPLFFGKKHFLMNEEIKNINKNRMQDEPLSDKKFAKLIDSQPFLPMFKRYRIKKRFSEGFDL